MRNFLGILSYIVCGFCILVLNSLLLITSLEKVDFSALFLSVASVLVVGAAFYCLGFFLHRGASWKLATAWILLVAGSLVVIQMCTFLYLDVVTRELSILGVGSLASYYLMTSVMVFLCLGWGFSLYRQGMAAYHAKLGLPAQTAEEERLRNV
ncbi:hypothetical protein [Marinospirillum perlucidum]|uniref:hypothetical protein n=1 Tax=Marinospirillum perlucidum TaxID=1982602 RepID=UPI000DF4BF52|nr:hypothetical protein [Marinospirillum perlucidum]